MNHTDSKENRVSVAVIGAGNVATHLSVAMKEAGMCIRQVFNRNGCNAKLLADKLGCGYTTNVRDITPDADVYVFALKDDALRGVIEEVAGNKGIWLHTAGSVPAEIFSGQAERYGVIYPMQTLSKLRKVDFSEVPLFVEGNTSECEDEICRIAEMLSGNVRRMGSEKRKHLHLAAVFACNFSNHMYALAAQVLERQGIERSVLQPLIDETANKLHHMNAECAQTGPAVRYDRSVIERHVAMLDDDRMKDIYKIMSESIHNLIVND